MALCDSLGEDLYLYLKKGKKRGELVALKRNCQQTQWVLFSSTKLTKQTLCSKDISELNLFKILVKGNIIHL